MQADSDKDRRDEEEDKEAERLRQELESKREAEELEKHRKAEEERDQKVAEIDVKEVKKSKPPIRSKSLFHNKLCSIFQSLG